MARLIETDSLANQNISAALAIGAYTGATIPRMVVVRVLVNQVAGGGDYIIYATLTKGGVEYRVIPTTTGTAAAALTSIAFVSIPIAVDVGDVLTVYIDGLAADTVTPDTRVDFYESGHLMPTTTDLTLDVSATGEAGLDFANIKQATAPTTLADITVPTVTTLTNYASQTIRDAMKLDASAGAPVAGSIDAHLDTLVGFGAPPAMISGLQVRDAMKLDASVGAPAAGSIDAHLDTVVGFGAPPAMIGAQAVRDAMKLDAGVGAPAAGSVDAHLDTIVGLGTPPNVNQIADQVWEEALAGHLVAGSAGKGLSDAGAAGDPWAAPVRTLTSSAAVTAAVVAGSNITVTRGDTWSVSLIGLGSLTTHSKLWFTVKSNAGDADTAALLQIEHAGELLYLNGAAALTAADGTLVVDVEATGNITITLKPASSRLLAVGSYSYDVQLLDVDGSVHTLTSGVLVVSNDYTRAVA